MFQAKVVDKKHNSLSNKFFLKIAPCMK